MLGAVVVRVKGRLFSYQKESELWSWTYSFQLSINTSWNVIHLLNMMFYVCSPPRTYEALTPSPRRPLRRNICLM